MAKKQNLPTDTNKRAKSIVDIATGQEPTVSDEIKLAAAALENLAKCHLYVNVRTSNT